MAEAYIRPGGTEPCGIYEKKKRRIKNIRKICDKKKMQSDNARTGMSMSYRESN